MWAADGGRHAIGCRAGEGSGGGGSGGGGGGGVRQVAVSVGVVGDLRGVELLQLCQRVLPCSRHPGLLAAQLNEQQSQLLGLRRRHTVVRETSTQR